LKGKNKIIVQIVVGLENFRPFQTQNPGQMKGNLMQPIYIGVAENEQMKAFDLQILIGNFKTKMEAKETADRIAEMLEGIGIKLDRAQ
jgi:hypothetical protein